MHRTTQPFLPYFSIGNAFSLYGNQRAQLNKEKIKISYNCITQSSLTMIVLTNTLTFVVCFPVHVYQAQGCVILLYFFQIKLSFSDFHPTRLLGDPCKYWMEVLIFLGIKEKNGRLTHC